MTETPILPPNPDRLGPLMGDLLDCAEAALVRYGVPTSLVHLAPGAEVAWDNCCEGGGQLYVRAIQMFPSGNPFPQIDGSARNCDPYMLAARVAVGVIRCAHTVTDEGLAPTAAQMTGDTLAMTRDAAILHEAVRCCFKDTPGLLKVLMESWQPLGPLGGCAGGEWPLIIGLPVCPCPTDTEETP